LDPTYSIRVNPHSPAAHSYLQTATRTDEDDGCDERTSAQSFFLVDFLGKPGLVTPQELIRLEDTFVQAYNTVAGDCWDLTSANILIIPNSFGDDDASTAATTLVDRDFSYLLLAQGTCQGCDASIPLLQESVIATTNNNNRWLKQRQIRFDREHEYNSGKEGRLDAGRQAQQNNTTDASTTTDATNTTADASNITDATNTAEASSNNATVTNSTDAVECSTCQAPFRSPFLGRWRLDFLANNMEDGSISSIFGIQEMRFADNCDPSTFTKFASKVVVSFNVSSMNEVVTDMQLEQLADLFQESYTALNELNGNLCDSLFRKVTTARATIGTDPSKYYTTLHDFNEELVYIHFDVAGFCQDCQAETNLFGTAALSSNRRRKTQELDSLAYCLCPSGAEERAPTEAEFRREYRQAVQDLNFVTAVDEVTEVNPSLCAADIVNFTQTIVVEIQICQKGLLGDDFIMLEMALLMTYNTLAERFCDPQFRTLTSATLIRVVNTTVHGSVVFEFQVNGKCRGCDRETVSIYEMPNMTGMSNRLLLEDIPTLKDMPRRRYLETCYCDTGATEERAPTEAEFIYMFRKYAESLALSCSVSVGECDFGSSFETTLVASFTNETVSGGNKDAMERSLLTILSNLYQNTPETCNPEFRVFQSITTTIGADFQPRDFGFKVNRRLQMGSMNATDSINSTDTTKTTTSPSSSPTMHPSGRPTPSPSTAPTYIDTNTYVIMTVSGICNGCQGTPILSGQFKDERRLRLLLANKSSAMSNCFCPVDAAIMTGPFAKESIEQSFEAELGKFQAPLDLEHIYEVNVVECEGATQAFDSDLFIHIASNDTLRVTELNNLTKLVKATYKNLNRQYCDPLERALGDLRLSKVHAIRSIDSDQACNEYRLQFSASGRCRGCMNGTSLVEEGQQQRALEVFPAAQVSSFPPRRRQLLGSKTCFCDQTTIANRAPTHSELQKALETAVDSKNAFAKICNISVPDQEVDTLSPTAAPTEKVCKVTLPDQFISTVIVSVNLQGGQGPTDAQINVLGEAIRDTYNNLNELKFSACDAEYRLISNATVDPDFRSRRLASRGHSRSSSISHIRVGSHQRRRANEDLSVSILFTVITSCQGCSPNTDLFDRSTISKESFARVYTSNVEKLISADFLDGLREVETTSCSSEITEFSKVVIVELVQKPCLQGLNYTGEDLELKRIEEMLVSTYNSLVLNYCDPFFRSLLSAEIVRFGVNTTKGNLPLEVRVNGTCRGCDPDTINLYDLPSVTSSTPRKLIEEIELTTSRRMQGLDTCYCDAQPVGDRAPFESEFVSAYKKSVEAFQLECIGSVGDCQFGTKFATGIVVSFARDELLVSNQLTASIEELFKRTINDLYKTTQENCNPEFRLVESVKATININITLPNSTTSSHNTTRKLGLHAHRNGQEVITPSSGPTLPVFEGGGNDPTLSPSTIFGQIDPDSTTNPTAAPARGLTPTALEPYNVLVLLYVSGICNGCENGITLNNQVIGRQLQAGLEEAVNASSNCYCPIDATLDIGQVSTGTVGASFQESLRNENVSLLVNELDEFTVVECDEEVQDFETSFILTFAVLPDITDGDINELANLIEETYNFLAGDYCDPLLRKIQTLLVDDYSGVRKGRKLQEGCFNLDIEFYALGTCRGCEDGVSLFDDNDRRRLGRELTKKTREGRRADGRQRSKRRRLQDSDFCFCEDDSIETRAPSFGEFADIFEEEVNGFVSNVCGFVEVEGGQFDFCDPSIFGEEFTTTVTLTLLVDDDEGLSLSELEQELFDTYNSVTDSEYDPCDDGYTELFFVEVEDVFEGFRRNTRDANSEARYLQPYTYVTITFVLFGHCQSFCQDDNLSLVLPDVIDRFERLDFVVFVEGGGGEFDFDDDAPFGVDDFVFDDADSNFDDDFPFDDEDDTPFDEDDSPFEDDTPFDEGDSPFDDDTPFDEGDSPFDDDAPFNEDDSQFNDDAPFDEDDSTLFEDDTPFDDDGSTFDDDAPFDEDDSTFDDEPDTPSPTPGFDEPDTPAPFADDDFSDDEFVDDFF
jgi:hypothetical protein